jgi:hypothetical protein
MLKSNSLELFMFEVAVADGAAVVLVCGQTVRSRTVHGDAE